MPVQCTNLPLPNDFPCSGRSLTRINWKLEDWKIYREGELYGHVLSISKKMIRVKAVAPFNKGKIVHFQWDFKSMAFEFHTLE